VPSLRRAPYLTAYEELRKISTANNTEDARVALQERLAPLYQTYANAIDALLDFNEQSAEEKTKVIQDAAGSTETSILIALGAALPLPWRSAICSLLAINRPLAQVVAAMEVMRTGNFSQKVTLERSDEFGMLGEGLNRMADDLTTLISQAQRSSIQVNTSATEIAATSKQQEATASEVAATTSQIGATAKEIAATSKRTGQDDERSHGSGRKNRHPGCRWPNQPHSYGDHHPADYGSL
jgi:methyl-accepting chemotaxis protein WspA